MRGGLPAVANDCGEWPGKAMLSLVYPVLMFEYIEYRQERRGVDHVEASQQSNKLGKSMIGSQD